MERLKAADTRERIPHRRVEVDVRGACVDHTSVETSRQSVVSRVDATTGREALEPKAVTVACDDGVGGAEDRGQHARRRVEAGSCHFGDGQERCGGLLLVAEVAVEEDGVCSRTSRGEPSAGSQHQVSVTVGERQG
jgi:hypothetical protein